METLKRNREDQTAGAPAPRRTCTVMYRLWQGCEDAFVELQNTTSFHVRTTTARQKAGMSRFAKMFVPSKLLHLRVVCNLCRDVPLLGKKMLQCNTLDGYFAAWTRMTGQHEEFVRHMVSFVCVLHRQHPQLLRQWVARHRRRQARYSLTQDVLRCLNTDQLDLSPPFSAGVGMLAVLLRIPEYTCEAHKLLCCENIMVAEIMDTNFRVHQELLLQLDPSLVAHPLMAKLALWRSMVDVHKMFFQETGMSGSMLSVLEQLVRKTVVNAEICKVVFMTSSWFVDNNMPELLPDTVVNKIVIMLTTMPQKYLLPRCALDRMLATLESLRPFVRSSSRRILSRMLEGWALNMLPKLCHWRLFGMLSETPPKKAGSISDALRAGLRMLIHNVEDQPLPPAQLRVVSTGCRTLAKALHIAGDKDVLQDLSTAINVLTHGSLYNKDVQEDIREAWRDSANQLLSAMHKTSLEAGAVLRAAPKFDPKAVMRLDSVHLEEAAATSEPPERFICPLLCEIMEHPVRLPTSKMVVDRESLRRHLLCSKTDPYSNTPLTLDMAEDCGTLRREISVWKMNH